MRCFTVKKWLLSRHPTTTKEIYLKNVSQLQAKYDSESVLYKFDDDNSGTLTCDEIYEMFTSNGIAITESQVHNVMRIVDPKNADSIDIKKLYAFDNSVSAKAQFRRFINKLRESLNFESLAGPQIPFMLSTMFDCFCTGKYQQKLHERIDQSMAED